MSHGEKRTCLAPGTPNSTSSWAKVGLGWPNKGN